MRSEFLRRIVVASSSVVGLCAQAVVPAPMAGVEGGGGTSIPFGSNQSCRYQVIYDAAELPWTGPRIVTGISLRPDQNTTTGATPAKGFLGISVLMSTTSRSSETMSATFAENYGTDATWVVQNQQVQLPAQPAAATGPRPANIHFAFSQPWAYGLTPATTGEPVQNLLLEIWIHSQPSGAYRLDNLSGCTAPTGTFGNVDPQCAVPGGVPVALTADTTMLAGSDYSWHVANAPASAPFAVALGAASTGSLIGNPAWPLPYPMWDPANPSLPAPALTPLIWPAPGCWINIDPLGWLSGTCLASGTGTATAAIPIGRASVGVTYFAQAFVLAPTANPLHVITSGGRHSTVCGPLSVTRNFAFYDPNATPPQPAPTAGSVQYGIGPVIEVQ